MKFKRVALYIVILGVLLGYYYYYEVHIPSKQRALKEKASRVFSLDKDEIDYIEIKGEDHVVLKKKGAGWIIVKPLSTKADKATVENLLASLVRLKVERTIGVQKDEAAYGLNKPGLSIVIRAGQKEFRLALGDKTPTSVYRYAITSTRKGIFLVDAYEKESLDKGLYALRYKRVVEIEPADVIGLKIEKKQVSLDIKKGKDGLWILSGNKSFKVKQEKISSLVRRLCLLEAKAFPGHAKGVDLARPDIRISLYTGKKSRELRFWDRSSHLYMLSKDCKGLVELSRYILDDIPKGQKDIQDRTFLHFVRDDTKSISLSYKSRKEGVLVKKDDSWFNADKKVEDQWKVDELLMSLEDLEYKMILNEIPTGAQPVCTIKLKSVHEKGTMVITFYKGDYVGCGNSFYLVEKAGAKRCLDAAMDVNAMLDGHKEKK
ncbi:MAG: DUF4340 domain-containing protein [Deltaproteobacteria bacterium]|nr:DUF4340 domain-containing protein [Deltaproteobacteria bacterium]